ncbi:unnamed protein product [Trifolium pratense]|uniref:Uncharacterized protein n=1 Tax=Trifolium pratense TaxID=57577 RepID=A0ACB0JCQ3_TRIPR|nr:unnamed protein product [Trifolium pratense]
MDVCEPLCLMQAEPTIASGLIQSWDWNNASATNVVNTCFQRQNGLPFFVEWLLVKNFGLMQAEPTIASGLIWVGALHTTATELGAVQTYSAAVNSKSPTRAIQMYIDA